MRVLVGMPDPNSLGGPAACEPPFVAELRRMGIDVVEETYVYGESAESLSTPARIRRVLAAAKRLRDAARAARPDVIHLNTSFDRMALLRDTTVLRYLHWTGRKIFLKFHGSDVELLNDPPVRYKPLIRSVLSRADGIGLLSIEERDAFAAAGIDERKLFVVKNVNGPFNAPGGAATKIRARSGLADEIPLLLFIARFIPAKGLLDVINAVAILRDSGRHLHLNCVGEGEQRSVAENEVWKLSIEDRVTFTGYISEAEAAVYYAASTLLVFPTYHCEGFPMVIFKSLAAGLPIVTTRIRAAADYLSEPENCLWTEPQDPAGLAEKIGRLLDDRELRAAMSANNCSLATQFAAEAVTPEYVGIYRNISSRES